MEDIMEALIGKNSDGNYYIAINDGQTEWLYWGPGASGDVIYSIPALFEEYPDLDNAAEWEKLYENHASDSPDEFDAMENGNDFLELMRGC